MYGSENDLSSFQRFSGEDVNREERTRLQKQQMKTWVQEQVAEKAYQKYQENEERMKYADLLKQIDEVILNITPNPNTYHLTNHDHNLGERTE